MATKQLDFVTKLLDGAEVEWKPLGEVCGYLQPTPYLVKSKDYLDCFETPVLTAGDTFILGYTDETDGIYPASKSSIILFDDFTTANKWVDFDFKIKSSAAKILFARDEMKVKLRYIYYWLNSLPAAEQVEHKRHWISIFVLKKIPIPPLAVQEKIVDILDRMTQYSAELSAELEARKKQYEYYRDTLLSFEGGGLRVQWHPLGEVASIRRGTRVVKNELLDDDQLYPVYQNCLEPMGYYDKFNCSANTLVMISAGSAGEIGYLNRESWAADDCWIFDTDSFGLNNKFLYYVLVAKQYKLLSYVRKSSIPRLSKKEISLLSIPIPPLEEQERIVAILDRFDTLCNSISEGLPRELELRQKQYEYYRDRLLSFA